MLARAREKVPQGEFHEAELHDLPLPDDSVDLVVCAIALVRNERRLAREAVVDHLALPP